jgi:L-ascorbate metabolism protein UlaG (beta-lactamase superfamily)
MSADAESTAELGEQRAAARPHGAGSAVIPDDALMFIGTATVLLRIAGFTLLTDPNFVHRGEEVPIGYGLRTKRLTDPAISIDQLPPLDCVVLSHLHGDHFDRVAEARLPRDLPIVTTRQGALGLGAKGFRDARGLKTWGFQEFRRGDARLRITAVPGRHGPAPVYALLPRVMGSIVEAWVGQERVSRIWISGDTLVHDRLQQIPRRFPEIDLGLVHLGGTRLAGILLTMDADQGVEALQIVRPRRAVPIHHGDYPIFRSPLSDFLAATTAAGLAERVRNVGRGEVVTLDELR